MYFSHPTAIIDDGCEIADDVRIWHFCHLMEGCRIGKNCSLGQNVFIGRNVKLGCNVKIQNNVSVYEGVECGDDVFIGPSVVFTNVINPRSAASRKNEYTATIIGKGVTIGANATILCGITIDDHAFIGAGAVITKPVKAYALMTGNPAKQKGWMSEQGYKLVFDESGSALCLGSKQEYRLQNNIVSRIS
jgi:UDP-2-acetamido-3-amino-2,3-dideoxy-glucuronate N-acetyltransferase